jgi:hypothetical protein
MELQAAARTIAGTSFGYQYGRVETVFWFANKTQATEFANACFFDFLKFPLPK